MYARNIKAFGWCTVCVGSLMMLLLCFFSQCFSWMSKIKECGVPVIRWTDLTILWRALRLLILSLMRIFVQLHPHTLSLDYKFWRIHMNPLLAGLFLHGIHPCNWSNMLLLESFSAFANSPISTHTTHFLWKQHHQWFQEIWISGYHKIETRADFFLVQSVDFHSQCHLCQSLHVQ